MVLDAPFGHACGVRVQRVQRVQKVQRERFLGLTGLTAGGFLSLTALRAEGCGIALSGDEYEVSVTGLAFCVIWQNNNSADWLAALASPYPTSPDFPRKRGRIKLTHSEE